MGGSGETDDASKYDEGTTPKTYQGEEGKKTNEGHRRGNQRHRRKELIQIHKVHRYFKANTKEVGSVLGLLSKELDIGTDFDKFREKLKGYTERNIENATYMMCVVTDMDDTMKKFEEDNVPKYLDEEEVMSILNKKRL